jgi:hypothetical protein
MGRTSLGILLILVACSSGKKREERADTVNGACFTCTLAPEGTIFCDDFENNIPLKEKYFEYNDADGKFILDEKSGQGGSRCMKVIFKKGDIDVGALRKSIGRTSGDYIVTMRRLLRKILMRYSGGLILSARMDGRAAAEINSPGPL